MDINFTRKPHIIDIMRLTFGGICEIFHYWQFLTSDTKPFIHAYIISWLDHCIGFLYGLLTQQLNRLQSALTHWDRVMHICISKLIIIGADDGLSPGRHQAIIWTNAAILLIGSLETNFSEILIEINIFSFNKIHLKMLSGKWRLFHLRLNELRASAWWVIVTKGLVTLRLYDMICSGYLWHLECSLTHWGLVASFGDIVLGQHWLR